jgi:hypothetical protein
MLISYNALGQNIIEGKVMDENNQPLEFVILTVLQEDSIIKEKLIKDGGLFSVELPSGVYWLNVLYFGHNVLNKEVIVTKSENIGELTATFGSLTLESFVVEEERNVVERKVDRLIFNVEKTIAASGGNALDVLKITPRIKVKENSVEMIGKGSVSVMIDDRLLQLSGEELTAFLETIKKEDIKSIEVITNPPAKYSAQGNSGLVNIKMKKIINDNWNASIGGRYHQATYAKGTLWAGFNSKKNKTSLYSNIYYSNGNRAYIMNSKVFYPNYLWNEIGNGKYQFNVVNTKLGVDYEISKKITTGFLVNVSNSFPTSDKETIKASSIPNSSQEAESNATTHATTEEEQYNYIANYHFIYKLDSLSRKISLDLDYFNYFDKQDRLFESESTLTNNIVSERSFLSGNNIGNQKIQNYSISLEMEHPFKWISFNYGGRISITETKSSFDYYDLIDNNSISNQTQSDTFIFNENVQSIYFSAKKDLSDKWETKAGLRIETTRTKGNSLTLNQINKIEYTKAFPTLYLTYSPNDTNSFSLNYGKRVNRPNYRSLNPFKWINSSFSYSEGNPYLQPSFSHNLELEYLYKDFWVNTLYFSKLTDGFETLSIIDSINFIQQLIPKNFVNNKIIGLNEDLTIKPYKWLKTNIFLDIYYSYAESTIPSTLVFLKGWNGEFGISNDFTLSKTAAFNISYYHITKGVDNLDVNSKYDYFDMTLRLLLLKKKVKMSISVNDVFKSLTPEYITYSNNIKNSYFRNNDSRYFRISLNYVFGNKKFNTTKRKNKNNEEINRSKE